MESLINRKKSIIPSCDFSDLETLHKLVDATKDIDGVGAYKIGFELVIPHGMRKVVEEIKKLSDKPIIYDHQKAATDIPDMGKKFVAACEGIDAIILFPQAGPITEKAWIQAVLDAGKTCIVGGEMTHKAYLLKDGGFIDDNAPARMYGIAAEMGIKDYVMPGNKPVRLKQYREFLQSKGVTPTIYSPGLVAQGGKIEESTKAAGESWHAIVGRGIYQAQDMKKAAEKLVSIL